MILINEPIPFDNFHLIRDSICAILLCELENQLDLQGCGESIGVWSERSNTFNQSEELMINVSFDSSNYSNHTEMTTNSENVFFIDVVASAKENSENNGGFNSSKLRDKYVSMIRFILSHHRYRKLSLPAPIVLSSWVGNVETFDPKTNSDTSFVKMSRIYFNVKSTECSSFDEGVCFDSIFSEVKLCDTDLGYKYEFKLN